MGAKIVKPIISIFIFIISFCSLLIGSLKSFLYLVLPDFIAIGGGEERDYADTILVSILLSLILSLFLSYLFNKKSKKIFFIYYILSFIILFVVDLYILRNRW